MPTKTVHVVPMLSPVLEDYVPPQFRGSIPDTPRSESGAATPSAVQAPQLSRFASENHPKALVDPAGDVGSTKPEEETGIRSRVGLMLLHWRKRAQRGLVQVPQKKPVQVQALRRQKSKKYPRSRRSVARYLNPLCLLSRLRDTYIHMMNSVAASGIVPGGPMGDDSGTHGSTMFFSREFDAESIAQLVELERSSSKFDTEYRQNMAFARNLSRVNHSGELCPRADHQAHEPVLMRSKSTKTHSADHFVSANAYFSISKSQTGAGRRLSGEPVLTRSKSNSVLDDVFSARKLRGSRKKLHINPFLDNNWASASVAPDHDHVSTKVPAAKAAPGHDNFHFHPVRSTNIGP